MKSELIKDRMNSKKKLLKSSKIYSMAFILVFSTILLLLKSHLNFLTGFLAGALIARYLLISRLKNEIRYLEEELSSEF